MPLSTSINAFRLLVKSIDSSKATELVVKKKTNDKPLTYPKGEKINFLPRDIPENHGYSKEYIESFFNELSADFTVRENRLLVIKDNYVIGERYNYPYVQDSWDAIFSASKTITALALGLLYDEGLIDLDVPVYKILKLKKVANGSNRKITLRHLLTMCTGNTFNEMSTTASNFWVQDFFNSSNKFKIGTKFEYNSMNTYVVSALIEKVSKKRFEDLVREKIFDPLHFSSSYFDKSPEGYFKGGWGLYLLPEDMAKLGILFKDKGMYEGKRIISEEWIDMMGTKQFEATKFNHKLDYGYQMWVDTKNDLCCFNGMFDQDIFIYKKSGVVLVLCCSNGECFHGANVFPIANKYFAKEGMQDLPLFTHKISRDTKDISELHYLYDEIANFEYHPTSKLANSCGLLPFLIQNELSTYVKGINTVIFHKENDKYFLSSKEGNKTFKLEFSFEEAIRQDVEFYGNIFEVAVDARFIMSAKQDPLLVIRIYFLEFASIRFISVKFGKDLYSLSMELSESPGLDFIASLVEVQEQRIKNIINNAMNMSNQIMLKGRIKSVLSPRFVISRKQAVAKKK